MAKRLQQVSKHLFGMNMSPAAGASPLDFDQFWAWIFCTELWQDVPLAPPDRYAYVYTTSLTESLTFS